MTAALCAAMNEWAIPYLNAHRIVATAFCDNIGIIEEQFFCSSAVNSTLKPEANYVLYLNGAFNVEPLL